MDYRKESSQRATTSQGTVPPTSSTSTGLNVPVPGPNRPVLNYPIQTGEEFALEFMQDRAIPRMPSAPLSVTAQASVQLPVQPQTGYMDFRTGSVANDMSTVRASIEKPKPNPQAVTENPCSSSTRPVPALGPPRAMSGRTSSEATSDTSDSKKVLISYGGSILPRPSDGKLRYVGGENRIIRISNSISLQELMRKTADIYRIPHTINYQIPGEDLDIFGSVRNDEGLRNMMELAAHLDEGGGGRQKLRIFLFNSFNLDFDDAGHSQASSDSDSEVQFPIA